MQGQKKDRPNKDCMLIQTFDTDKYIRIIGCSSIVDSCFVIPDIENVSTDQYKTSFESNNVIMLKDKKTWSKMFLKSEWI